MAATRITLSNNSNQSQVAPLLIPASACTDPFSPTSIRKLVLKAAHSKLKLKKPTRIFVAGCGCELFTEQDWKRSIENDVTLLVSSGEDYVGIRHAHGTSQIHPDTDPNCEVEVLAEKAQVDSLAVKQLKTTARTLPGMVKAVGQPDLHPGTKFPIGGVFVSNEYIHPPLIGSDIGCGMAWYRTRLSREQVEGDRGRKVAEKLRGLEGVWRTQKEREMWLEEKGCSSGLEWDSSLGTIGAGNHFAEVQVVEEAEETLFLRKDEVILLVHSGSRGYGGHILEKHTFSGQTSLHSSSDEAHSYLEEHNRACCWAFLNRSLIALRFLNCLEPGEPAWNAGRNGFECEDIEGAILIAKARLKNRMVVDISHNNVEKVKWPPSQPPTSAIDTSDTVTIKTEVPESYAYVHRKGAAPTYDSCSSLPLQILPLPGSRGTPTLILAPVFDASTGWGSKNALSLAHGSGRIMSRAKALSSFSRKYKAEDLVEPRGGEGTWVVCEEKNLVFEEAPEAYKDVEAVAGDLLESGVARVVGRCSARVSYKVRNEGK